MLKRLLVLTLTLASMFAVAQNFDREDVPFFLTMMVANETNGVFHPDTLQSPYVEWSFNSLELARLTVESFFVKYHDVSWTTPWFPLHEGASFGRVIDMDGMEFSIAVTTIGGKSVMFVIDSEGQY